jgi:phage terminase Nu1 subunit (DNA packaging protein)
MDKKQKWRDQEQQLVERWTAANERYRLAHASKVAAEVQAAQAELELLRRQVARLKSEFSTGKRY